jgi:dimethylargininase
MGAPDYQRALQQHGAYCEALEICGLTLTRLEPDEGFADSTFVEDTAVITTRQGEIESASGAAPQIAILTRPGAPSRRGEVTTIEQTLTELGLETRAISAPGTVDGGDICEAEGHFFIGISQRTNEAGGSQLSNLLNSCGKTMSMVDIRNMETILHLKSGLAFIGDNRLVVTNALRTRPVFAGYELVSVEDDEAYASNCVRINEHVLVASGFPRFERKLNDLGYKTVALDMGEFQKLDGGLSCLSLRF